MTFCLDELGERNNKDESFGFIHRRWWYIARAQRLPQNQLDFNWSPSMF